MSLDIKLIKTQPLWKPLRRHAGPSTDQEYFQVMTQITKRFEQEGLQHLVKPEKVLLSGKADDVVDQYPELLFQSWKVHLAMFNASYTNETCSEVSEIMRNMVPEVRSLFNQSSWGTCAFVPALSAEAERGFSALRCLVSLFNVTNPTQLHGCLSCSQRERKTWTRRNCIKNLLKLLTGTCTFLGHCRIIRLVGILFF